MTFRFKRPVWIHIDHIDNAGGRVWAVQVPSRRKHFIVHHVVTFGVNFSTRYRRKTQPRAYLICHAGHIIINEHRGRLTVEIYGTRPRN